VDDNPIERSLVRELVPEVEVPELPADPALYIDALDRGMYFEATALTDEDRRRAASYRENAERQAAVAAGGSLDEFLSGLGMRVELRHFDEANLARIVQLINKTNQFNLTTRRFSTAEVTALLERPDVYTQFLRLRDRFGDNGITGILMAYQEGSAFRIHNWLMSCRVLGRRVEDAMLAALFSFARRREAAEIIGEYIPTAKNGQVANLYERFGFEKIAEDADGTVRYRARITDEFRAPAWLEVDDTTQEPAPEAGLAAVALESEGSR
jgi:FkbH-like protein